MEYWEGVMNWPLDTGWVCEVCGGYYGLEWGLVHAQCRCNQCHTEYTMRDSNEERTILTIPHCMIKDEYREPLIKAWSDLHIPVNEITMEQLEPYMEVASK